MPKTEVTGFHHYAIRVSDRAAAIRFYEALGFNNATEYKIPEEYGGRTLVYLEAADGTCVEVCERRQDTASSESDENDPLVHNAPLQHVCLRTADLDADLAVAKELGARVVVEPRDLTLDTTTGQGSLRLRLCFVEGPSGEQIELIEGLP